MYKEGDDILERFYAGIEKDPRIRITHMALFMSLYHLWLMSGCADHIAISSHELMEKSKISSTATYHKAIKALHEYGYLQYRPSYNNRKKSIVYLLNPQTSK